MSDDAACSEISCGSRLLVSDWLPYFFDNWSPDRWKGIVVMDIILNFDDTNEAQTLPDGLNRVSHILQSRVQTNQAISRLKTVSYTHLTLPTSVYV